MKDTIETLVQRQDLTLDQSAAAAEAIIAGADPCQAAALLVLLRSKGETPAEVAGMVRTMRRHMLTVSPARPCIDIVGTGGDGHHTVNISTAASVVAAACGAAVAKHGNRSVSSKCGSADVLEEVGVSLALPPSGIEACIAQAGIAFMFAPGFHPAMKNIVPVRKALGVRTVFNILGPLINPAACTRGVIGVYAPSLVALVAEALHALGAELIMVVHCCGLDELAPIGEASVATVTPAGVEYSTLDCTRLGFAVCSIDDLKGGDCVENAASLRKVLSGTLPGPIADTVALNAGAGLYVAGVAPTLQAGCKLASEAIAAGSPISTLDKWVQCSQAAAAAASDQAAS
ncbi:hypothetical protein EMIHUDRAFT_439707 [Emiliania huxleyi CCMP1516]|uniref:anthranilate phosphoribosyltransferase n=2 Tax=Emiliania huxleyi TaxID=2903 RepID=A0A0D3KWG2_EMIH1|nr:hypothetical protein EMIHUDRAFT_439707 [Emiliania huxleyi CCMP1516]EOD40097.1 hypothetical protein EMIHUDRAFT_439707 [Emiliania huxleyi CCMP1516]|eukprot:XP_005792526.1 hypothetical protein EMIHUDRAFT_439707 [Emiliania huxleyi CCMP1516]